MITPRYKIVRVDSPNTESTYTVSDSTLPSDLDCALLFRTKALAQNFIDQHELVDSIATLVAKLDPQYRSELLDVADNLMRTSYFRHIQKVAEAVEDEVRLSRVKNEKALTDALIDVIHRSPFLVGTSQCLQALRYSGHPDAYMEEHGKAPCDDGDMAWPEMAFWAILRDVQDLLPPWTQMHPGSFRG